MPPKSKETATKRKKDEASSDDEESADAQKPAAKATKPEKTTGPVLSWLLSDEAFDMANPAVPAGHGEIDWDADSGKKPEPAASAGKGGGNEELRYPHSALTPFQNLVAACLLSKPISHKLGVRTIETLLNPPFGLTTLQDLDDAGFEGRRRVMWEARTQHKEKTAAQLGDVVRGIRDLCGDDAKPDDLNRLQQLRNIAKDAGAPDSAAKAVVDRITKIKGIGPGVASIFLRRVQRDWVEVFPYADERSLQTARTFDLIEDGAGAVELADLVDNDRHKYVRLLDVLVGLSLEKSVDAALKKAKEARD